MWRMGRDSNPRYLAVHTLSRRAQSTALAPIRNEPTSLVSIDRSCNPFVTPGGASVGTSSCSSVCSIWQRRGMSRCIPGRCVYPTARSATILWRRHACKLQRGMRCPSDVTFTNHFSPLTCGGSSDNRSAIAFSSVSSSA
jgi:hypothetical protein